MTTLQKYSSICDATPEPFWLVGITGQVVVICCTAHVPGRKM